MARLSRRNYGRGHGYKLDCDCTGRGECVHKIPGVTTILGAKAKNALVQWAADETAKAAVNRWDELSKLDPIDRYKVLAKARYDVQTEAATRGTDIHTYGQALAEGKSPDVPDHLVGPVEGYARALDLWDIEAIGLEAPCCSTRYRYGGTLDSIARIGRIGVTAMVDLKSGKGVYAETVLQLAGYLGCDLWQPGKTADGKTDPSSEQSLPDIDRDIAYVLHIGPDSTRLLPVPLTPGDLTQLLWLKEIYRWDKAVESESPIGAALRPEDYPYDTDTDAGSTDG